MRFKDRLERREIEKRLAADLQAASERARLARDNPEQFQLAWKAYMIALDRFQQFVGKGFIPPDLVVL